MLDHIYRSLAEFAGLGGPARDDIVARRRFPAALETGVYFSLPRAGRENEALSERLIAEFGVDVIKRVPGFTFRCRSCDGRGAGLGVGSCRSCAGLGEARPRFRSVRGGHHDYAVIGLDEEGLGFWGYSRQLPFDSASQRSKYILLSSSRVGEPSVTGLPKYHIAGRNFPVDEVVVTEGIIKAEVAAWKLRQRVIGLHSTSVDARTLDALLAVLARWEQ